MGIAGGTAEVTGSDSLSEITIGSEIGASEVPSATFESSSGVTTVSFGGSVCVKFGDATAGTTGTAGAGSDSVSEITIGSVIRSSVVPPGASIGSELTRCAGRES